MVFDSFVSDEGRRCQAPARLRTPQGTEGMPLEPYLLVHIVPNVPLRQTYPAVGGTEVVSVIPVDSLPDMAIRVLWQNMRAIHGETLMKGS